MLKVFRLIVLICAAMSCVQAQQRFFAEKSSITFFSDGVVEDISAKNEKVTSIFDIGGDIAYLMSVKDFQFPNKLMQTHFNEKYMESEKFPKSSFQGKVTGFNLSATGKQQVKAIGKLTIHGVTKDVEIPGTAEVTNGNRISLKTIFPVKLSDYNITIPQIIWQNVAQQVEVTADFIYRPQ